MSLVRPVAGMLTAALIVAMTPSVSAHPVPFSFIDVRLHPGAVELTVVAHMFDLANDLKVQPPERLLEPGTFREQAPAIATLIQQRLQLAVDGEALRISAWSAPESVPERQSIRLAGRYALSKPVGTMDVTTLMFPYDPQHKTFLNVYENDAISAQAILDRSKPRFQYFANTRQGTWAVIRRFVPAGVHHMLVGPDHLMFLAGLLLLGGTLKQLFIVIGAFTIAHSVTLALAALGTLIPPANTIGPAVAFSVIYVGTDNLLVGAGARDTRALVAFAFGLVHGFGFANVLREMDLPGRALGWTLFSFNIGVEIGQFLVVVLVASLFARIRSRSEAAGRRLAFAGSIFVVLAGAFWFVQRVFFSGGTA